MEIREANRQEFEDMENRHIAHCESIIIKKALGQGDADSAQINAAKWILERRTDKWSNKSKSKDKEKTVAPNGKGQELLNKFKKENHGTTGRDKIPSKTIQ